MRKLMPPDIWFVSLLSMIILHFIAPGAQLFSGPWRLLGLPFVVAGAAVELMAYRLFRKHDTTIRPFEESSAIVTEGPYAISRHPMYLGMALILAGAGFLLGSVIPFFVVPAFVIILTNAFIVKEEIFMERRFGDGYREYRDRVRRWL